MKRFFVDEIQDKMILTGDNHNHLAFVMRAKLLEKIVLCKQDGFDYIMEITAFTKKETHLQLVQKIKNDLEPDVELTLFMSILKGDKMEYVVQKTTELGINAIYPLITRFVTAKNESVKKDRLEKIILESAKQCGRGKLPILHDTISFENMLNIINEYDLVVFPYENETVNDIKAFLKHTVSPSIRRIAMIIGSEGGFSDEEAVALRNKKVVPLSLGKRILRAETACVAVTAMVMYEAGQMK